MNTIIVAALILVILILLLVLIMAAFVIKMYNDLVRLRNNVKNSFAQIDAQLQKRFDLLPNLMDVVKGYASHEKKILENVEAARNGYLKTSASKEKMAIDKHLSNTLKSLYVVSGNYPELKANVNFLKLQEELTEIEDKVTFARQFYNDAVTMYNNKLQMFPANMIGKMFGFKEEELFDASEEAMKAPVLVDENDLTDEEKARYPLKCPNCMGAPDGTRYCPYCGARVV